MLIMSGIETAQLKLDAVSGGAGHDPAVRACFAEGVACGRQAENGKPGGGVLGAAPVVNVTVDVAFDFVVVGEGLKEAVAVLQAAFGLAGVHAGKHGVVMCDDECGLVRKAAQGAVEPAELEIANEPRWEIDVMQGVEQHPVHESAGDHGDVLVFHRHLALGIRRAGGEDGVDEIAARIVITERAVDLDGVAGEWLEFLHEGDIVLHFAIE